MEKDIFKFTKALKLCAPTTREKLKEAEERIGIIFPTQYKDFMLYSNGAEGFVGLGKSYLQVWDIEEVISAGEFNATDVTLCLDNESPPVVCFAANGIGSYYAFDKRTEDSSIIGFESISIIRDGYESCGRTFFEFLQYLFDAEEEVVSA